MYICLTCVLFTFSYWSQILPSYLCFISIVFTGSFSFKRLMSWVSCLWFPLSFALFAFYNWMYFVLRGKTSVFWGYLFHHQLLRGKGKLLYRIICLLFSFWSLKNDRADLYSCVLKRYGWWKYNLCGTVSVEWFHRHCSPSPLYQGANGELYVPIPLALFCVCKTWKCLFSLVLALLTEFCNK